MDQYATRLEDHAASLESGSATESGPRNAEEGEQRTGSPSAGETAGQADGQNGTPGARRYKRASRKGAARRFVCDYSGCEKRYSRTEHLQRHQLNHNPKEIFMCDVPNCQQRFVRVDLLERHKKRHSESYVPRNRIPSFKVPFADSRHEEQPKQRQQDQQQQNGPPQDAQAETSPPSSTSQFMPINLSAKEISCDFVMPNTANSSSFETFRGPLQIVQNTSQNQQPQETRMEIDQIQQTTPTQQQPSNFQPPLNSLSFTPRQIPNTTAPVTPIMNTAQQQPQQHQKQQQPLPQPRSRYLDSQTPAIFSDVGVVPSASLPPLPEHVATTSPLSTTQNLQAASLSLWPQPQVPVDPFYRAKTAVSAATAVTPFFRRDSLARTALESQPLLTFSDSLAQGQSHEGLAQNNFGMWLFDPNMTAGFNVNTSSFVDSGLESTFNNALSYDYESSRASHSQFDAVSSPVLSLPGHGATDGGDDDLSDVCRTRLLDYFRQFYRADTKRQEAVLQVMREADDGDIHALRKEVLRDFVREYWVALAPRMPIIHQPTFSINGCPTLLLVVMMALGAASISLREPNVINYTAFSDMLIEGVRWEILRSEDATPPVALWAAQALLLVELYEKMYSVRKLHERAHIHHSITLNLLRRGSPLIGRSGSETPPGNSPRMAGDFGGHSHGSGADGSRQWWLRWAETEAMHRVVFTAFMMDIIHACMFGHIADMQPHEIRLPLPCDDSVWCAPSPDRCRQMEATIRMYGVEPVTFLDGLRKTVHTQEVKSHPFARMIIMSGLLSVAWHIRRNSLHLNWLDGGATAALSSSSSTAVTVGGKGDPAHFKMVLKAFDTWKASFDHATSSSAGHIGANGPLASASLLYHLAYVSLRVDIIDCQVYAGVRRLLGRKVSTRDYQNAVGRMKVWARDDSTRQAILHAFKLLHCVLDTRRNGVATRGSGGGGGGGGLFDTPYSNNRHRSKQYSVRDDPDPHRPWIMYFATLSIWAFVRVYPVRHVPTPQPQPAAAVPTHAAAGTSRLSQFQDASLLASTVAYLEGVARLEELTMADAEVLAKGVALLLETMQKLLGEAKSELLLEAKDRLQICREVLYSSTG